MQLLAAFLLFLAVVEAVLLFLTPPQRQLLPRCGCQHDVSRHHRVIDTDWLELRTACVDCDCIRYVPASPPPFDQETV